MRSRIVSTIGRRGCFLLFLSMLDIVQAYGLIFPTPTVLESQSYIFLSSLMPLHVWGTLWGVVGIVCLYYAFKRDDMVAFSAGMFIKSLWAFMFLLGWALAGIERGYLLSAIWGAFALTLAMVATWSEDAH